MGFAALAVAAFTAAGGIIWFLLSEDAAQPEVAKSLPKPVAQALRPLARPVERSRFAIQPHAFAPAAPPLAPRAEPGANVGEIEQRYRMATAEDREDIAREIAAANNADAVHALGRVFPLARRPDEKLALLSALGDVGHESAPDGRLAMLAAALAPQHREVRIAALGSLADFDDPRALSMIREIAAGDADKSVREFAGELLETIGGSR